MGSLADVFRILNEMRADGVVSDYAIGGATAENGGVKIDHSAAA